MSTPVLAETHELVGRWLVVEDGSQVTCAIELTAKPVGRGHVAITDPDCLARLQLLDVAAWRPAPDGIALAASTGRTVAFFTRHAVGCHVMRRAGRPDVRLRRA